MHGKEGSVVARMPRLEDARGWRTCQPATRPDSQSLCPDCKHMVEDILAPMFESGVADLMTLK